MSSNIPADWKQYLMDEVLDDFRNGYAFEANDYVSISNFPIVRMSNIGLDGSFQYNSESAKYCSEEMYNSLSRFHLGKGDLVVAMTDVTPTKDLIGRGAIVSVDKKFILNQRVGLLKLVEKVADKKFVSYWTNSNYFRKYSKDNSGASAQANLGTADIKKAKIILPPLNEQKKIAEILTSVDRVIELTSMEIDKLNDLKKGMMQELLSKGIGHTKFKDSPVGKIPESWDYGTLDLLGTIGRGKSKHRPRNDSVLFGGKYPFIQTGEIRNCLLYVEQFSQTYSEIGLKQSRLWPKGTLCVTIAANIAESAILTFDACFPDSVLGFTPHKNKSNTLFVKCCFDSLKAQMEAISAGTAQGNMSMEKLEVINFPIPTLEEQDNISNIYLSMIEKIKCQEDKKDKLIALKKGLMNDLLTGKVRVRS